MKKIFTLFTGLLFLAAMTANVHANAQVATQVVKDTADKVIERLNSERTQLESHPEQIYSLINELVIPHFDFVSMSKWVLGKKNWLGANEIQQQQFVNEFRTLLVRTYAKALLEYSEQEIVYLPTEENPSSTIVQVKTRVEQPGSKSVPIDYSMHASGGEWKVVDVAVDGISLVATYRGSFASKIRKDGMDALIASLSERNTQATHASAE